MEDLPSDKDSVTAKVDSPSALRKGSSTRSFGSVTTCDDIDVRANDRPRALGNLIRVEVHVEGVGNTV